MLEDLVKIVKTWPKHWFLVSKTLVLVSKPLFLVNFRHFWPVGFGTLPHMTSGLALWPSVWRLPIALASPPPAPPRPDVNVLLTSGQSAARRCSPGFINEMTQCARTMCTFWLWDGPLGHRAGGSQTTVFSVPRCPK